MLIRCCLCTVRISEKYFREAATGHVHWRTLVAVADRFLEDGCSLISSLLLLLLLVYDKSLTNWLNDWLIVCLSGVTVTSLSQHCHSVTVIVTVTVTVTTVSQHCLQAWLRDDCHNTESNKSAFPIKRQENGFVWFAVHNPFISLFDKKLLL
jgi:hypothetical protein